jgi:hypothetical protein
VSVEYDAAVEVREAIMSVAWELASIKGWLETIAANTRAIDTDTVLLVNALDGLTTQVAYLAEKG